MVASTRRQSIKKSFRSLSCSASMDHPIVSDDSMHLAESITLYLSYDEQVENTGLLMQLPVMNAGKQRIVCARIE
jgi:hypothetical protein